MSRDIPPPKWTERGEEPPPHTDADGEQATHSAPVESTRTDDAAPDWSTLLAPVDRWDTFTAPPPPPDAFLSYTAHEDRGPSLAMPRGAVSMLASPGGVGKTMALCDLAICAAIGRPWLHVFKVHNPGPVLLAVGEEAQNEIRRRLYNAARLLQLSDREREDAGALIHGLPGHGHDCTTLAVTDSTLRESKAVSRRQRKLEPTEFGDWLKEITARNRWSLIILDPAAQFMPADGETDNGIAARWVNFCASLANTPGKPAVVFAHHMGKAAAKAQSEGKGFGAAAARGASALTDGIRMQWNMATRWYWSEQKNKPQRVVRLSQEKNNYGPWHPAVYLRPSDDERNGGALEWCERPPVSEMHGTEEALLEARQKAEEAEQAPKGSGRKKAEPADVVGDVE